MPISFLNTRGGPATPLRLDRMEQNLDVTFGSIKRLFLSGGPWNEVRFVSSAGGPSLTANPWDWVMVDPSAGACTVLLPDHTAYTVGEIIIKNFTSSVNAISIKSLLEGQPPPPTSPPGNFVNGGTTFTLNTARATVRFRTSSDGWWVI